MSAFPSDIFRYNSLPSVASNVPVTMTESRSLITIARASGSQRWEIQVDGFVLREYAKEFQAFLMSLNGQFGVFTYSLPVLGESQASNKTVASNGALGAKQINVTSAADIVAGDMFTFSNHSKVYQVSSVESNTVKFFPALKAPVTAGAIMNLETPVFTVRLRDNYQQFTAPNRLSPDRYSISMIEVL